MSSTNVLPIKALPKNIGQAKQQLQSEGAKYAWDGRRYWNLSSERVVPAKQLRGWVDSAIETTNKRIGRLTEQMINGKISFPAWATTVQPELKAMHTGLANIAIGGRENFDNVMAGRLGGRMHMLYDKLNGAGLAWERGEVTGPQMMERMRLATEAGRGTYEGMRRGVMMDTGATEEMRVLGGARHCEDCPPLAGFWAPIGSLPGIGDSACLSNCVCDFEYR